MILAPRLAFRHIGWFEEYTGKASHERAGWWNMTALAVKLSTSGRWRLLGRRRLLRAQSTHQRAQFTRP